jgi:3-oxoacyl-[acyl-carrier protein] reductase
VALVTGASGGIGQALCHRLIAAGVRVAMHYSSSAEPVEQLAARAAADNGTALAFQADLSDAQACARLICDVREQVGPVDLLIVNHGRAVRRTGYEDVSADDWDTTMAVNTRAAFLLARDALPRMRSAGYGRVLFTSSVAALTGGVVGPDYAASKAALHGLVHYLAARVATDGVTVNAIAPALIENTGMLPGNPAELAARIPVRRLGRPAEVADLAVAILANGYITNQVISVDGGMHPG